MGDTRLQYKSILRWIFCYSRTSRNRICRLVFLMSLVSFAAAATLFFLGASQTPDTRQEYVYGHKPKLAKGGPTQGRVNLYLNTSRTIFEKYRHNYSTNAAFVHRLKGIMQQDWNQNERKNREFRADVRKELGETGSIEVFCMTKNNAQVGTALHFYMAGRKRSRSISESLWKYLPEDAPFTSSGQFKSCSVVGSSGIMTGSGCGQQIDQSQFILRFNIAPVAGFEADVGSKTNLTTLNPTYIKFRMNRLQTEADRSQFSTVLKQFNGSNLWLPTFSVSRYFHLMELAADAAFDSNLVQPLLGHPKHFLSVTQLWRNMTNSERAWPTTGLYFILTLIDICDQLDLFGFWPYERAIDGSEVPYHYHDNITGKSLHIFDTEFKTLVNLHEQGIIKMHFGSCL